MPQGYTLILHQNHPHPFCINLSFFFNFVGSEVMGGGLGGASLISGNFFICRTFHWVFLLQYHALKRSGAQKF